MEEQSNEALWYVVHTYSGYENKVRNGPTDHGGEPSPAGSDLRHQGPDRDGPRDDKNGKERMVEHKLFPGYVLVKMVMNDDTWYVVRNTRGCTGFVGPASKPVPPDR